MKKRGFTLIELIIAMAIIAILVTISLPSLTKIRQSSRDGKRKADLQQLRSALEIYRGEQTVPSYPNNPSYSAYQAILGNYMTNFPNDPLAPTRQYTIVPLPQGCSAGNCNRYVICAALESEVSGGPFVCSSGTQCGTVPCNYAVDSP